MEYYKLLQLDREPFSNSPDPEFFFNSRQHMGCLQKLELALRLKRGLNVVIGDVGTGKTTLCRQLIRKFSTEPDIETHLVLDPTFDTPSEFLKAILDMLCSSGTHADRSQTEMKEMIKRSLFQSGVDENKTVVLIIDEGQKISDPCLEILRELLNYETNTYKLLQIVIFAQMEFNAVLQTHANFADRINLLHHLKPLRFIDTKQLIQHRLKLSSAASRPISLFTLPALWAIYRASHGYPRKIIHLCHQSILALIIQNQTKAGWMLIQSCKKRLSVSVSRKRNIILTTSLACLAALFIIVLLPVFKVADRQNPVPSSFKSAFIHDDKQEANPVETPLPSQYESPPELLGQLIVKPGDTLSVMALDVYGTRHSRFLRSIITSNSHIQDPDNIDIGHIVLFPSIAQHPYIPETPFFMVVLDEYKTLPAAMQRLEKIAAVLESRPKMVASWSPAHGLRFQIIQRKYFSTSQAARGHIDMMPYAIATRSKILSGWPEDTIFYSDPFKDVAPLSFKGEG